LAGTTSDEISELMVFFKLQAESREQPTTDTEEQLLKLFSKPKHAT